MSITILIIFCLIVMVISSGITLLSCYYFSINYLENRLKEFQKRVIKHEQRTENHIKHEIDDLIEKEFRHTKIRNDLKEVLKRVKR